MSNLTSTHPFRIVRDEEGDLATSPAASKESAGPVSPSMNDHVAGFWQTYTETTGWRIDPGQPDPQPLPPLADGNLSIESTSGLPSMTATGAKKLAAAASKLAEQLRWQQETLKRQQSELAARAAVIATDSGRADCGTAIDRILSNATIATSTVAAAVYLLDDETEFLATRFLFGLSPHGRLGVARPLRGSRADLEAMIQGVVAIDDLQLGPIDTWRAPEKFAAAICASIGGTDLPIGTLWLFAAERFKTTIAQTASARIAAENIHQLLSSPSKLNIAPQRRAEAMTSRTPAPSPQSQPSPASPPSTPLPTLSPKNDSGPPVESTLVRQDKKIDSMKGPSILRAKARQLDTILSDVARWQHHTLPVGTRLADDWIVDGMIESPVPIAQSWHHWDVLPDGQIAVAICQSSMAGTGRLDMHDLLTTTLARAALQAHLGYRHQPADAVRRVLDTLWQIDEHLMDDDGRPAISLLYSHVNPETGELVGSSVGPWTNLIASRYGYRPLGGVHRHSDHDTHPVDRATDAIETVLQPGEVWFVGGGSWLTTPMKRSGNSHRNNQNAVGNAITSVMKRDGRCPLAAVRRLIADQKFAAEMTAIGLQRTVPT